MKSRIYILVLALCTLFTIHVQAQDDARLSERTLTGTARYMGMGGAMTAIGGDPSAVRDNPAGLGLYRRMEVLVTMGGGPGVFMVPQISLVLATDRNNFMFSYNRLHSFNHILYGSRTNDPSLGAQLAGLTNVPWDIPFCSNPRNASNSLRLRETGYLNEYNFDWGMRISHQWYVGAGFHVQSYLWNSAATYEEVFEAVNDSGQHLFNINESIVRYSGSSCNFSVGVIYRPTGWLRLGFSLQTPSLGVLHLNTSGTLTALTDSLRKSYAPDCYERIKDFHLPLRLSLSTAFQIGAYGMIALQYDYTHQKYMDDVHSLRAGFEVIPVMGMYINGGYACESSFKKTDRMVPIDESFNRQDTYFMNHRWKQYASVAIGYRGTYIIAQAAYQYSWQRFKLYAHDAAVPYEFQSPTHRVVVTIGWHKN